MEAASLQSVDEVVEDIMRLHRSLPARPGLDEVEAAKTLIRNVDKEDQARLDAIGKQTKGPNVPEELFQVMLEMQRNLVYYHSKEQKREALRLLDLESLHSIFDDFIQRASNCVSSSSSSSTAAAAAPTTTAASNSHGAMANSNAFVSAAPPVVSDSPKAKSSASSSTSSIFRGTAQNLPAVAVSRSSEMFTRDDSYVSKSKSSFYVDGIGIGIGTGPGFSSPKPQIVDPSLKTTAVSGVYNKYNSIINSGFPFCSLFLFLFWVALELILDLKSRSFRFDVLSLCGI